jgi:glycosyltransferase involved in cell wall biosynthesis
MNCTVSVIIPAYNAAPFIEQTVRAVVAQSYQDWELLVVNNASEDETGVILERLKIELNDPRIRIRTNLETLPACENWNAVLSEARGEFLKLICADDIPSSNSLERQVKVLKQHSSVALTTGASVIINGEGKLLFVRQRMRKSGCFDGNGMIRRCLLAGTNIIGDPVHVMWRKSASDKVGLFDPNTPYASDVEFWLRLLTVGDLYYDPEPVGFYRIHGDANSAGRWRATAQYFVVIAKMQVTRGRVSLSKFELQIITAKAYLLGMARQLIYHFLG